MRQAGVVGQDGLQQPVGHRFRLQYARPAQGHQELVAPIARHHVRVADGPAEDLRQIAQHAVPRLVAEGVVDRLEAIQVQTQQGHRLPHPTQCINVLGQVAQVVEARQPVGVGVRARPVEQQAVVKGERSALGDGFEELLVVRTEGGLIGVVEVDRPQGLTRVDDGDDQGGPQRLPLPFHGVRQPEVVGVVGAAVGLAVGRALEGAAGQPCHARPAQAGGVRPDRDAGGEGVFGALAQQEEAGRARQDGLQLASQGFQRLLEAERRRQGLGDFVQGPQL